MNPHSYRLKGRDFVHQGKIEIDVNERAVFIRTQGCFFVYTNSDCFLNNLGNGESHGLPAAVFLWRASVFFFKFFEEEPSILISHGNADIAGRQRGGTQQHGGL